MLRKLPAAGLLLALLAGCSGGTPSHDEIEKKLATLKLDQPHCATGMFGQFPLTLGTPGTPDSSNADVFDAFVKVGLLRKDGLTYSLTDAGKAAYQPERKGFCYSDGFSNEIKDVSELDKDDFGPAVEKGWLVTFEITPRNVQDWVKNPELLGKASRAKLEDLTQPQVERVKLLKLRGEEGYKLVAPTLSIEHGIYFDQGWRP